MLGCVDDFGRALVPICLRHPMSGAELILEAWIDTAFSGELVVPGHLVASLGLPSGPGVRARLADGSELDLDTVTCLLEWFGSSRRVEAVTNQGQGMFPLLGTGLLSI